MVSEKKLVVDTGLCICLQKIRYFGRVKVERDDKIGLGIDVKEKRKSALKGPYMPFSIHK